MSEPAKFRKARYDAKEKDDYEVIFTKSSSAQARSSLTRFCSAIELFEFKMIVGFYFQSKLSTAPWMAQNGSDDSCV